MKKKKENKNLRGFWSGDNKYIESNTFEIVNAGLQLSFKISKHIAPLLLILQWYILVRYTTFGGLNGYSCGK